MNMAVDFLLIIFYINDVCPCSSAGRAIDL